MRLGLIGPALLLLPLVGCDRPGPWTGWVYPDGENDVVGITLSGFDTFEECQAATIAQLRNLPDPDRGSYECGRSCRWNSDYRANICKEMRN